LYVFGSVFSAWSRGSRWHLLGLSATTRCCIARLLLCMIRLRHILAALCWLYPGYGSARVERCLNY
jgi:hypothetical protein